jgi:hypothetical protein
MSLGLVMSLMQRARLSKITGAAALLLLTVALAYMFLFAN